MQHELESGPSAWLTFTGAKEWAQALCTPLDQPDSSPAVMSVGGNVGIITGDCTSAVRSHAHVRHGL